MAVEASKLVTRDVYEITYDNSTGSGTITATFENPDNGDKSSYKGADDGKFIVTVAKDYSGSDAVEVVSDENGETLDTGTITFG